MAAVLGAELDSVESGLKQVRSGVVEIANWNSRDQIVIAGDARAVEDALEIIDPPRAVPLPVSAPFHCRLMKPAEERLAYDLDQVEFKDLRFPIIGNADAKIIRKGAEARESLKRQVSRTVRWYESMMLFSREGIDAAVELGSGAVLSGLMKRISREWERRPLILTVNDPASLDRARRTLNA
jgi:[acyl-carrier-protein] S-malonyltransferase